MIEDPGTAREHIYGYAYDGQGRLEEAHYATDELGSWTGNGALYYTEYGYGDKNGNLSTIKRNAEKGGALTAIDDITRTVRRVATELDVSIIFIGTENAGRISTPVTSVGSPLSKDPQYDVHIVRHAD